VQITQELCKSIAELCNLVAKTSTAISKLTNMFYCTPNWKIFINAYGCSDIILSPLKKYFHENVYFSWSFVKMTAWLVYWWRFLVSLISFNTITYISLYDFLYSVYLRHFPIYSFHITLNLADTMQFRPFLRGNAEFVNKALKQRRLSY
jgi:hypothetical protein